MNNDSPEDKQRKLAQLGIDAEVFINTPLGEYFLNRVEKMSQNSITDLIDCEPDDIQCNTKHRNQIQVAGLFKIFLAEAVDDGRNAHEQMREDEVF